MIRILLCGFVAAGLMVCSFSAAGAVTVQKKKTATRKASKASAKRRPGTAVASTSRTAPRRGATRTSAAAARRNGKKAPASRSTTWRNRQMAPTPERYKEIQDALVAKGYLKAEDAGGGWNQNSVDALKRFQSAQNLDSTGKINSLSIIALGLGPKRDSASSKSATEPAQTDR